MFGGLELKGGRGGGGDDDKTAAPASISAFGFLNAADPAATTDSSANATNPTSAGADTSLPMAGSSGFSFLNIATTDAAAAPEPVPAALSGFSFLQETPAVAAPEPASAATDSGFSFMIPSPDKAPEMKTVDDTPEESAAVGAGVTTSAFSFLGGNSFSIDEVDSSTLPPLPSVHVPTVSIGSTASSVVTAPSPVPTSVPVNVLEFRSATPSTSMATGPPGLPSGAGITFGTAAPQKVGVRKKKTRAQKIGMGTAGGGGPPPMQPMPAPAPAPAPSPKQQQQQQHQQQQQQQQQQMSKPPSPKETRDAAAEAQLRAEEFMARKTLAEATATPPPSAGLTIPTYDENPPLQPTASNDEEVARAKRAAEEAQKMAAAATNSKEGRGGFMGTFFKGFGGSSNSSLPKSSSSGHGKRTSPTPSTTNAVDKLAKQQQEMKWAAAERQMQLQQQTMAQNDDDDDDEVVVSTSVGGYYQPEIEPASLAQQGTKMETTTATSRTTFQPITPVAPVSNGGGQTRIMVKELAPTPKKKKTPTQAFEEYQAMFAQSVHRAIQQVDAVRSQQKMLSEERFVAIAKQRLAIQQIQQTEAQLQVAVENEDYELADQLGQLIEAHNREKAEVASVLDSIAMGLQQLDSQKGLVVQGVATCFDNLAVHIKALQEQENSKERDASDPETFKQFEMISKQLSAEQERLNQDQKHLEKDEQLLAEERNELEVAISEQSGEYERQRDGVKEKLSTVEEEIAELRRQLEAKSKIAAGLRTEMHGLEDNISRVRVKFSRQLTRVDKKERSLNENRLELETERAIFQRQKEAHELQVQSHSQALLAHDALIKTLEDELKLCKGFAGMVSTKLGFMPMDAKSKEAEDAEAEGNLAQLQADVVKCEAACSEAKVLLKAATATVSKLEAEHSMLVARVPQLEAEKKSAAAKRDFKAASKASKEIKDATARLKECEEELVGEATDKKKAAEEELARLSAELDKARKIAEEEEKVSGIARMDDLAQQIKNLVATKQELCGDVSSNQNTVKGVGAFVLDGQIKALKDEGQDLGSKYGGWNELIKDIFGEEIPAAEEPHSPADGEGEAPAPDAVPAPAPVDDGLTSAERISKVRGLVQRIQEAEEALEAAAEREDYEEAARLQDVFENLQMELENTNLTDEESELAFAEEDPTPAVAPSQSAEVPAEGSTDEAENENATMEVAEESAPAITDGDVESSDDKQPPASEDDEAADEPDAEADESAEPTEETPQEEDASPGDAFVENGAAIEEEKETKEPDEEDSPSTKGEEAALAADDPVEAE